MRVLIAGCGDVGNILAGHLLLHGHTVFGLKRDISTLPDGVCAIAADLTRPSSLTVLPANLDRLVFMPTPSERTEEAYSEIFIEGWKNLWSALPEAPARCLLVSSTAVYGQDDGSWVDEHSDTIPAGFNGRVLLAMEKQARETGVTTVIARLSGIYGPGRERLIKMAASADADKYSSNHYSNRIHIEDAGAALEHLLYLQDAQELYLVSDNQPVAKCEVMAWLSQQLGHQAPSNPSKAGNGSGKRVSNRRLRESGYEFQYPDYRAGYGQILQQRKQTA